MRTSVWGRSFPFFNPLLPRKYIAFQVLCGPFLFSRVVIVGPRPDDVTSINTFQHSFISGKCVMFWNSLTHSFL